MQRFVKIAADGSRLRHRAPEWAAVLDTEHDLLWQVDEARSVTLPEAIDRCRALRLAGVNSWRIPNSHELNWLAEYRRGEDLAIKRAFFPRCQGGFYWALSRQDGTGVVVNFGRKLFMLNTLRASPADRFNVRAVCIRRPDSQVSRAA